jgi:4-diphosphocytidyl-2-C-methyl-D-erythritol kinase
MTAVMRETAWAKINLALHIRARRDDGYHDLETIFAFVDQGDDLTSEISDRDQLIVDGPFAAGLTGGGDNLVTQAVHVLRDAGGHGRVPPLTVHLTKNLPVAAGIGGGSADAAAMARLVRDHFLPEMGQAQLRQLVAPLGADVAACVDSDTCIGLGTGADLQAAPHINMSGIAVLLVNPREPVATGPIFKAWDQMDRGPLFIGQDMRGALIAARNDLQRPAIAQCPAVADVLTVLGRLKPWLARMSGSGGTCFALFESAADRDAAAAYLAAHHPIWWRCAAVLR